MEKFAGQVNELGVPERLKTKIAEVRKQYNDELQSWNEVVTPANNTHFTETIAELDALLHSTRLDGPQHDSISAPAHFKGNGKVIKTPP